MRGLDDKTLFRDEAFSIAKNTCTHRKQLREQIFNEIRLREEKEIFKRNQEKGENETATSSTG